MSADEIVREYHEAESAWNIACSEIAERPELRDMSAAVLKAAVINRLVKEHPELADRHREAVIAHDQLTRDREERYIAAHEFLKSLREGQAQ